MYRKVPPKDRRFEQNSQTLASVLWGLSKFFPIGFFFPYKCVLVCVIRPLSPDRRFDQSFWCNIKVCSEKHCMYSTASVVTCDSFTLMFKVPFFFLHTRSGYPCYRRASFLIGCALWRCFAPYRLSLFRGAPLVRPSGVSPDPCVGPLRGDSTSVLGGTIL